MNYELNRKYFNGIDNTWPKRMIIAGVIIFFVGCASNIGVAILGLLVAGAGVALVISRNKGKISDAEYDSSVASNISNMKARALAKLGIDEDEVKEASPISFGGYRFIGADRLKYGDDRVYRTNKYEMVMLFFSQNEVHCYTYTFDTTSSKQTEATDVYFYKDIVSVSTASDNVKVVDTDVEYEAFKLTTAGGTSISISLRDVENAQRSINAMRSLIKSKKVS